MQISSCRCVSSAARRRMRSRSPLNIPIIMRTDQNLKSWSAVFLAPEQSVHP
ncbi:hypothetical protein BACCAP_03609 [Pseudoflavonifractor capillosus ATCC 29799]|uniref:Uncharacterized protein n=1 Tax=Pseudoflavonifractor capillosus ATCC 29799 TaxID=411467 RepID=A6NZF9_9FIRM|nr:hypothetical protein BACCAP_03609 [Pseudoflavonifractor capillosus ATCC 29799]